MIILEAEKKEGDKKKKKLEKKNMTEGRGGWGAGARNVRSDVFLFFFVHIIIKPTSSRCYGERMRHRIRSTQTRHILLPRLYFIVRMTAMVIDFVIEYNVKNSVDFNIFINFNSRKSFMFIAGWVFIEYYVVRKSEII